MIPLNLQFLDSLVQDYLNQMTNQAYSRGMNFSFRTSFEKGDKTIIGNDNKEHNNYYVFKFFVLDKKETIPVKIDLYETFYPIKGLDTVNKIKELALKEFLLNGLQSLFNITYSIYVENLNKKAVEVSDVQVSDLEVEQPKEIIINEKPKLIV